MKITKDDALAAIGAAGVMTVLFLAAHARARDVGQFQYRNPEISQWIKGLTNRQGEGCCDTADGYKAEAQWDTQAGGYSVLIDGEWVPVPEHAVITGPNKLGYAMEWHYFIEGKPIIRCFLPGTLS